MLSPLKAAAPSVDNHPQFCCTHKIALGPYTSATDFKPAKVTISHLNVNKTVNFGQINHTISFSNKNRKTDKVGIERYQSTLPA